MAAALACRSQSPSFAFQPNPKEFLPLINPHIRSCSDGFALTPSLLYKLQFHLSIQIKVHRKSPRPPCSVLPHPSCSLVLLPVLRPAQIRSGLMAAATPSFEAPRLVVKKVLAKAQEEGVGARVRRSIGRWELRNLDPFLMLDEFTVSAPAGFPDHPHRGFETVTYMLEGAFTHQDFAGHRGTIKAGDLQWMTAGRGIVHSEMPAADGENKGLQLWINLAAKDKMMEPKYQELQNKDIARVEKDGVEVRVIAGESFGVRSPVYTQTPTMYLDVTMKPGAEFHQRIPETWNALAYIIDGEGVFGEPGAPAASSHHAVVLSNGDGVSVWNRAEWELRFVLIGGQLLREPIVQHGPFVMNTQAEIRKAFEDYQYGKNGFEKARFWKSQR